MNTELQDFTLPEAIKRPRDVVYEDGSKIEKIFLAVKSDKGTRYHELDGSPTSDSCGTQLLKLLPPTPKLTRRPKRLDEMPYFWKTISGKTDVKYGPVSKDEIGNWGDYVARRINAGDQYTTNGTDRHYFYREIIEEEPKKCEGWVNIYDKWQTAYIFSTKKEADERAVYRTACIRIEWVEGQGLEEKK